MVLGAVVGLFYIRSFRKFRESKALFLKEQRNSKITMKKQGHILCAILLFTSGMFAQNYALDFDGVNDGSVSSFIR